MHPTHEPRRAGSLADPTVRTQLSPVKPPLSRGAHGSPRGKGVNVPRLQLKIGDPAAGVAPRVVESAEAEDIDNSATASKGGAQAQKNGRSRSEPRVKLVQY